MYQRKTKNIQPIKKILNIYDDCCFSKFILMERVKNLCFCRFIRYCVFLTTCNEVMFPPETIFEGKFLYCSQYFIIGHKIYFCATSENPEHKYHLKHFSFPSGDFHASNRYYVLKGSVIELLIVLITNCISEAFININYRHLVSSKAEFQHTIYLIFDFI